MLLTPTAASRPIMLRSWATEWLTAVRWAMGSRVVSVAIRSVTDRVVSRVEPPAPYVMDTNDGRSDSSSRTASHSWRCPSGVFGGKNSNEKVGPFSRISAPIVGFPLGNVEGSPVATPVTVAGQLNGPRGSKPARPPAAASRAGAGGPGGGSGVARRSRPGGPRHDHGAA